MYSLRTMFIVIGQKCTFYSIKLNKLIGVTNMCCQKYDQNLYLIYHINADKTFGTKRNGMRPS